ncbi:MAG: NAD(P)-binding domain-containing protein [Labilithrix sp.]|nr:NAD(P)-binding domain-containing protein [Labilithrix sp.]
MTFALIGAGFSGLGVAAAFRRHGIDYEQFEAADAIGGNWHHGVYETVHIISSRKTTEYGDFPMPSSWPDFPSARQMLEYLNAYADHHDLRGGIRLSTKVTRVEPVDVEAGTWKVSWERANGERGERIYDGVVVCNGHHWSSRMPKYPGAFGGELIHSKSYKSPEQLAGKRVLVIGGGNSACDIAVEAARFAQSAHISMRRGYWFLPKTFLGVPLVELMQPWMPPFAQRAVARAMARVAVGPYERYGLQHPDHRPFDRHPTINSELLYYLRHGEIAPHPDIERWDGRAVRFVDGHEEEIDLVIAATGFDVRFPFLADGVVAWKDGYPQLIGGLVPPDHKNIYFFGLGQPRYGAGPLITAGADLLCEAVATQRRLEVPLGAVLARLGSRPPRTWLQDPFAVLRQVRLGKRLMPRLPAIAPLIMGARGRRRGPRAPVAATGVDASSRAPSRRAIGGDASAREGFR